jgi:cell division protein FtsW
MSLQKQNKLYVSGISDFYGAALILGIGFLVTFGLVMVASSSMEIAQSKYGDPFFLFKKQLLLFIPGLVAAYIVYKLPLSLWQEFSGVLLCLGIALLFLVLIPGIGREVNGSQRWISLGFASFQPSELCKIFVVLYMAAYLVRRQQAVRNEWKGFLIPIGIMGLLVLLLLLEPDFGSVVVLLCAVMSMLFLAGVKLQQFMLMIFACLVFGGIAASAATYRLKRLTAFTNPWEDQFGSGYQLTQSLIAFGRGEWLGVGLGESIQKLFYLPEAHTDFLYAILAEEFGLFGSILVIAVFCLVVFCGMKIGKKAEQDGKIFPAYVAYGLSVIIGVQAFINMGVCSGLLPTKGLTLPFMSYGGTSLAISVVMVGFLLRVNFEVLNNLKKINQKKRMGSSQFSSLNRGVFSS